MAVRCCWPPESCDGVRPSMGSNRSSFAARETRASISAFGRPSTRSGEAMFS